MGARTSSVGHREQLTTPTRQNDGHQHQERPPEETEDYISTQPKRGKQTARNRLLDDTGRYAGSSGA
jgi:hypothetical protein